MKTKKAKVKLVEGWGLPDDSITETGYDDAAAADKYYDAKLAKLPVSERMKNIEVLQALEGRLKEMKSQFSICTPEFVDRLKQLIAKGTEHETSV